MLVNARLTRWVGAEHARKQTRKGGAAKTIEKAKTNIEKDQKSDEIRITVAYHDSPLDFLGRASYGVTCRLP